MARNRIFVILTTLALLGLLLLAFVPQDVTLGILGEEIKFVRSLDLNGYEYCNGTLCLRKGDSILGIWTNGHVTEFILQGDYFATAKAFNGPVFTIDNGNLTEIGYLHGKLVQTNPDEKTCVLFEQILPGSCFEVQKTLEIYSEQ